MSSSNPQAVMGPPPLEPSSFEEMTFAKAAQLLADPLTESTRKRQSFLLLLSLLSLAIFFGIVEAPDRIFFSGAQVNTAKPLDVSGAPSKSLVVISRNALRFNQVLTPVLIYALLAFWLSVYRDRKAADYLAAVPLSELTRSGREQIAATREKRLALQAMQAELNQRMEVRDKEWDRVTALIKEIEDRYAKKREPVLAANKKAFDEFDQVKHEASERADRAKAAATEANAELYDLSVAERTETKPYLDEREKLNADPKIAELRKLVLQQNKEMEEIRLGEKTVLLADVFGVHFRWKKYWRAFEVWFPILFGLCAILIPAMKFF